MSGKLRRQVSVLHEHPDAAVTAGGIVLSYGRRCVTRKPASDMLTFRMLLHRRHTEVHVSTYLMRRCALLGSVGLFCEEIPGGYGEDYDWLLRATRQKAAPLLREPLAEVTWHRTSYFALRWLDIARGFTYLIEQFPEFAEDRTGLARLTGRVAFAAAACGDRDTAERRRRETFRLDARQPRIYLSWLVEHRFVRAATLQHLANLLGRGI
jgi:hypothetical protein